MPSNTTYDPINDTYYDKTKMEVNRQGIIQTITIGQTENIDFTLTDDMLFDGARVLVKNGIFGDSMDLQIVHPSLGVLVQFVTAEPISGNSELQMDFTSRYPAKLLSGLIIRLTYHSTGAVGNPRVAIGYSLHKILV